VYTRIGRNTDRKNSRNIRILPIGVYGKVPDWHGETPARALVVVVKETGGKCIAIKSRIIALVAVLDSPGHYRGG
jgi:hypothetical protein